MTKILLIYLIDRALISLRVPAQAIQKLNEEAKEEEVEEEVPEPLNEPQEEQQEEQDHWFV